MNNLRKPINFDSQATMHATHQTTPKSISAMVRYNTTGYHRHRLRNVRIAGAFVEMGNARVLRKDSQIQIVFVFRQAGHCHTHRLEAKVDRVDTNGAQLSFCSLDDQAQAALSNIQGQDSAEPLTTTES